MMALFDIFRRRPPIRDTRALADFIDQNAAFITQKGIYEHSRARAGHYAKVLFREPEFQTAADHSRWRAYPLGLAMVSELVEGVLCVANRENRHVQVAAIGDLTLAVFDRYPVPASMDDQTWGALRAELSQRVNQFGLHPPKWAKDIPEQYAQRYFDLMPIHEKLRLAEFPTIRNYLRVTMCNIHDEFTKRADVLALVEALGSVAKG
jgi:hypothetical protein